MFYIRFENEFNEDNLRYGEIKIGDFQERFLASADYWTWEQYQKQWKDGIQRIINGQEKSCLITDMSNPKSTKYIFWRPMYLVGNKVFFQDQILLLEQLESPFDENSPFLSVSDRKTISEEGDMISEWEIDLEDVVLFFEKISNQNG